MIKHLNLEITGRVQGVAYRYFAKNAAERLGLTGYVHNQSNGSVWLEVEGEEGALEQFHALLKQGPPLARVDNIVSREVEAIKGFSGFTIK